MSKDDHLSNEVSVSAALTETGIQGKARSRAISGVDRLIGNVTEFANVYFEEKISSRRSRIEAGKLLSEAAVTAISEEMKVDRSLAERALTGDIIRSIERQENKESVARKSIELLEASPPTEEQEKSGAEKISPDFLNRFERYTEDASTDEVREKWASVLAAEVKNPGTFSGKSMRILDEIDSNTANRFQEFAKHNLVNIVPNAIYQLSFDDRSAFQDYDLILSNIDTVRLSQPVEFKDGTIRHIFIFGGFGIGVEKGDAEKHRPVGKQAEIISWHLDSNKLAIPSIIPTSTGISFLGLMEDRTYENVRRLLSEVKKVYPKAELLKYDQTEGLISVIPFDH